MRRFIASLASLLIPAVATLTGGSAAHAWEQPPEQQEKCDFVTGGGFIFASSGAKANFGVHGGCKNGSYWGHLNYIDHGSAPGYHVRSTGITGYFFVDERTRDICGTAVTNRGENVFFRVRVTDNGEPGRDDIFGIRLSNGYFELSDLGGTGPGGGNIQLHKPNRSTLEPGFGGDCDGV